MKAGRPFWVLGILCVAMLPVSARAQKPLFWIGPTWFEADVTQPKSAPVGQITLGCAADKLSNSVDWGDGTSAPLTMPPGATHQITYHGMSMTLIGPGTFNLYPSADKTFAAGAAADPFTARIFSTVHCLDGTETEQWLATATMHVKARTPLKGIELSASPDKSAGPMLDVKGGWAFKVRIKARDRSSLARIHIDLKWDDPGKALVSPPKSVDVPLDMLNVDFVVQTRATRKCIVGLKANTIGDPVHATINVVP
jgi:hypothetical protein